MPQCTESFNPPASPSPANCNKPISWKLEEVGITPPLVGAVGELCASLACYAETRQDRKDLQLAAAAAFDVAARMRRRHAEGVAHG